MSWFCTNSLKSKSKWMQVNFARGLDGKLISWPLSIHLPLCWGFDVIIPSPLLAGHDCADTMASCHCHHHCRDPLKELSKCLIGFFHCLPLALLKATPWFTPWALIARLWSLGEIVSITCLTSSFHREVRVLTKLSPMLLRKSSKAFRKPSGSISPPGAGSIIPTYPLCGDLRPCNSKILQIIICP